MLFLKLNDLLNHSSVKCKKHMVECSVEQGRFLKEREIMVSNNIEEEMSIIKRDDDYILKP